MKRCFRHPQTLHFALRGSDLETEPIFNGVGCMEQYKTYSFVSTGDFKYDIPVARGKYAVSLLFSDY